MLCETNLVPFMIIVEHSYDLSSSEKENNTNVMTLDIC
jgi:hypothetical protein